VGGAEEGAAVLLVPQNANAGGRLGGAALNGGMHADGRVTIPHLPPGHYPAVARSGGGGGEPKVGMQAIVVNGENLDGVTLLVQPGVTLSGNITVESSGTPAPADYSTFRIDAPADTPLPFGAGPRGRGGGPFGGGGRSEKNGTFQVPNLL